MSGVWFQMSVVRRMISGVWYQMFDVRYCYQTSDNRYLTSDVWQQQSEIRHLRTNIWNQTTEIRRLTSHVWNQTPDIRRLTLDICDQTSDNLHLIQTFKFKRLMTDFWYQASDVWFQMSVIRCLMSIVWYQTSDNMCLISDVWCQISVIRRHRFSGTNKPEKLWGVSKMLGQDRGLSRCFSLTCVSGKTHNLEAVSWKSYLVHKDDSCGPRRS